MSRKTQIICTIILILTVVPATIFYLGFTNSSNAKENSEEQIVTEK